MPGAARILPGWRFPPRHGRRAGPAAPLRSPATGVDDPGGGTRWPVRAGRVIPVPAVDGWRAISRPVALELGHPGRTSNPVRARPGPDARDGVHHPDGPVYELCSRPASVSGPWPTLPRSG
jgi:hypothetical protein